MIPNIDNPKKNTRQLQTKKPIRPQTFFENLLSKKSNSLLIITKKIIIVIIKTSRKRNSNNDLPIYFTPHIVI